MSLLSDEQAQEIFKSEHCNISKDLAGILYRAIEAAVLEAQGKQKPVAWMDARGGVRLFASIKHCASDVPLYAAPVVQPDMVMVPREPTEAMEDALQNCAVYHLEYGEDVYLENFKKCYQAMIAAAEGRE